MKGYVYILTNSSFPNFVKIGMTLSSPHHRAAQLSSTGVPQPFKVFGYVEVENPRDVECRIHEKLYEYRVSSRREFFEVKPQVALQLLEKVTGESEVMRKEKAKRLELEQEKSRKKSHEIWMRKEWSAHIDILRIGSNHGIFSSISDYVGYAGWIIFWTSLAFFYIDKEKCIPLFITSIAVGSVSLLFSFLADTCWNTLRTKANRIMAEKYGKDWDAS